VITSGPAAGQKLGLERNRLVMIGRDEDCSFQILDPKMSRRHLQVRLDERTDRHHAIDFSSANGVLLNGARIEGDAPLSDGDVLEAGDTRMVYQAEDAPDARRVRAANPVAHQPTIRGVKPPPPRPPGPGPEPRAR
jgi:S-DNA-T family DNA segregation ATPase FtsK/SpoIIIE